MLCCALFLLGHVRVPIHRMNICFLLHILSSLELVYVVDGVILALTAKGFSA
jgi:hypothetical protein